MTTLTSSLRRNGTVRNAILGLMQTGVKLNADEIAGALDLSVLSVRPRVTELGNQGFLTHTGTTKANRRGNLMIVWTRRG